MNFKGKGMFTWILNRCEGGDIGQIIKKAQEAQITFLMPKIADGPYEYEANRPYLKNLVEMAHAAGIKIIAWQYVYGQNPIAEAERAIIELKKYPYDGFVINAETQYKNRPSQAKTYCQALRSAFPEMFMALSSYRYPSYHANFPFNEFLEYVDANMPQVYWEKADGTAVGQLQRCLAEFADEDFIQRPIMPTGAAYTNDGWVAKAADIKAFIEAVIAKGLSACSFWEWHYPRERFPELWEPIAETRFPGAEEPEPIEPDPEPEDGTFWAVCTAANALSVRSTPVYYKDNRNLVGYLVGGKTPEKRLVYEVDGIWWRVGDAEWVSSNYMEKISEPAPLTLEERVAALETEVFGEARG
jgi:hypothetical protein